MPWKDSRQIENDLFSPLSREDLDKIETLFCAWALLNASIPVRDYAPDASYADCIIPSAYGEEILARIPALNKRYSRSEVALAALCIFFHQDLIVDLQKCDPQSLLKLINDDLINGNLRLPYRYGRTLYDKFNDQWDFTRVDHLDANKTDEFLTNSEQGVYQIGYILTGPLGLLLSQQHRVIPPVRRLPLWHCSDTGCRAVHEVNLGRHKVDVFSLRSLIRQKANSDGPQSAWQLAFASLQRRHRTNDGHEYYDLVCLIADTLQGTDLTTLLNRALSSADGPILREALAKAKGKSAAQGSAEGIADRLSRASGLQLLSILTDTTIVRLIDETIRGGDIKIPPTEIRKAKVRPARLSQFDTTATMSALGIRSDRKRPLIFLSSLITKEYERTNQLSELAWRCQKNDTPANSGTPLGYMRNHSPRDAIRNLVLISRPITLAIAERLNLVLDPDEAEDELVDRLLWKFGFNLARYEQRYERLRQQLGLLKDKLIQVRTPLNEDARDEIRGRGVNVFVSLEKTIEEMIAYNVWLLGSDHFINTRFTYKFKDATSKVAEIIGREICVRGQPFIWNPNGGNTLGVLLIYARATANWILNLAEDDKASLLRDSSEMPFFADSGDQEFPFRHRQLWADIDPGELKSFGAEFDAIVTLLEKSRPAEIRNGLDHFRDEDQFPELELLIACESRISDWLDRADLNRFLPKAWWVIESKENEFGLSELILSDYRQRKLNIYRPSNLSAVRTAEFSSPVIIPFGNLLGQLNAEIIILLNEESAYSRYWSDYPRRPPPSPSRSAFFNDGQAELMDKAGLSKEEFEEQPEA